MPTALAENGDHAVGEIDLVVAKSGEFGDSDARGNRSSAAIWAVRLLKSDAGGCSRIAASSARERAAGDAVV